MGCRRGVARDSQVDLLSQLILQVVQRLSAGSEVSEVCQGLYTLPNKHMQPEKGSFIDSCPL